MEIGRLHKIRDDYETRCKIFSEIFSLQLILSVMVSFTSLYCIVVFAFNIEYKVLFIIEILNLLAIAFDIFLVIFWNGAF